MMYILRAAISSPSNSLMKLVIWKWSWYRLERQGTRQAWLVEWSIFECRRRQQWFPETEFNEQDL